MKSALSTTGPSSMDQWIKFYQLTLGPFVIENNVVAIRPKKKKGMSPVTCQKQYGSIGRDFFFFFFFFFREALPCKISEHRYTLFSPPVHMHS